MGIALLIFLLFNFGFFYSFLGKTLLFKRSKEAPFKLAFALYVMFHFFYSTMLYYYVSVRILGETTIVIEGFLALVLALIILMIFVLCTLFIIKKFYQKDLPTIENMKQVILLTLLVIVLSYSFITIVNSFTIYMMYVFNR